VISSAVTKWKERHMRSVRWDGSREVGQREDSAVVIGLARGLSGGGRVCGSEERS
jgi:hypothetical protein